LVSAAILAVLGVAMFGVLWQQRRSAPPPAATGELTVDSTPAGARVLVGGKDRGTTPLLLRLPAGAYDLDIRIGDERHLIPVRVKEGATTEEHVLLHKGASARAGTLRITSDPPSAAVTVDGHRRGTTPLSITDLPPGQHDVRVTGTSGSVRQRVRVDPDATTTVMVPLPRRATPQSTGGYLSITAPVELQVFEGDRLLGTTRVNPLTLPTGLHQLRVVNEAAGINLTRQVTIAQGRTARWQVTLPPGTLSINAVPWASVTVDGKDVGETPLGSVEVSPGLHQLVFTHPRFGERRQQVLVRSGVATRVAVDFRR